MIIVVIGLGYVGLPLACLCAKKGYDVIGIDINKEKVEKIKQGINPIKDEYIDGLLPKVNINPTTDTTKIQQGNIVIICVPTPVNQEHLPDLSYVETAAKNVAHNLQENQLVILESTVYPGTTEEVVQPILEATNTKFYLAHCPERIDPGNKKYNVENIPRVVGGINKESTNKAKEFYKSIIEAEIISVKSSKEAEATKIMENTFRDINIAFMNEMAKSFEKAGIDILEVIKGASSKPFGFLPHYPGCGVGGHCIAVDPYYLIDNAKKYNFHHEFLLLARKINDSMPRYTVELLKTELKKQGNTLENAKVGILGLAYKGNVDDDRESPALDIIKLLKQEKAAVETYDPFLLEKSTSKTIVELFEKSDYLILATNHDEFKNMEFNLLNKYTIKIIIDGRNCLDKSKIKGVIYKGIGR